VRRTCLRNIVSRRAFTPGLLRWSFAVCILWSMTPAAAAHPGALDAAGCHTNHSTGEYHCHSPAGTSAGAHPAAVELQGRVVAVTDGDTIKVLDASNTTVVVRLNGIDAPERAQPFGAVSRKHLESLVAGQQVLVRTMKHDRYGRVLGNVWVQPRDCPGCDKTLYVNYAQVLDGMAWWYRYYAGDQTPEDRGRFESAEREAMARRWGLWADPDPVPPWLWRSRK